MKQMVYFRHGTEMCGLMKWVDISAIPANEELEKLNVQSLQAAVNNIPATKIVSIRKNTSGVYKAPMPDAVAANPNLARAYIYKDLPDYYEVIAEHSIGSYTETITVWLPVKWNGRFLGTAGGGSKLGYIYGMAWPAIRFVDPPIAIANGFASATTDGGNVYYDTCLEAWPLDSETGKLRTELLESWRHRATHNMTIVAKKITEAAYKEKINYSYLMGTSGGGRQSLMEASEYPEDYDGIFACAPAINFVRFCLADLWPDVVMNNYNNILPPAKLDAFKEAVWKKYGGKEKYFSFDLIKRPEFNAADIIGKETACGAITELDAKVMQMIWDGPKDAYGNMLWYGVRPGSETWGKALPVGICSSRKIGEKRELLPSFISLGLISGWLRKGLDFNWKDLTIEAYVDLFRQAKEELSRYDCNELDFSQFRADGKKLLWVHGLDDELIMPEGSIDAYLKVIEDFGSKEAVEDFLRFYLLPGDGHSMYYKNGCGLSLASGMTALMEWVEDGVIPGDLMGQHLEATGKSSVDRTALIPFLSLSAEDCK